MSPPPLKIKELFVLDVKVYLECYLFRKHLFKTTITASVLGNR